MKIAYSCAGEGFGHAARMVVVSGHLEKNHQVSYFVPREVQGFLQEKIPGFAARDIPVLAFRKKEDRVDLFMTLLDNIPAILAFPFRVIALARRLRREGHAFVISDFEPLLAWAGRLAGLPVLQINHPGVIASYPGGSPASFFARLGARLMEGPWTRRLHISFYGGQIGPLYRPSLFRHQVMEKPYLVINLKPSYRDAVLKVLENFPHLEVRIFPAKGQDFEKALAECSGVISPAGHQIIAESMVLGKPILALPQQGQYEQELNTRMVEALGRGMRGSLASLAGDIQDFIIRLPQMRAAMARALPEGFTFQDGTRSLMEEVDRMMAETSRSKAMIPHVLPPESKPAGSMKTGQGVSAAS